MAAAVPGCECRRFLEDGGDAAIVVSTVCGDADRMGDTLAEMATARGPGEAASAQAALASGKKPPVAGVHELFVDGMPSLLSSSGVDDVNGLGEDDGALAMTERGGRMVKIWFSDGGGPYESKGSGTVCNIGSITGSDLVREIDVRLGG